MEPWRALLNERKFEEARRELDEAQRTIFERMEQSRRELKEHFERVTQELGVEFKKARAEIDEAERTS